MALRVNGNMVVLGREYRGLSQVELAERLGITASLLCKIEKDLASTGESLHTALASALSLPASFFTRSATLYSANLHWRKRVRTVRKALYMAEAEMNVLRLLLEELLASIDLFSSRVPHMDLEEGLTPEVAAQKLRQLWSVPIGPIENVTQLLERHGVFVVFADFDLAIDGYSMLTKEKQPIIFINRNKPSDRQRFTAVHELAHLILHVNSSFSEDRDVEKEANRFASEFLVQGDVLSRQICGPLRLDHLADLKRYWRVSMQAILYKAHADRRITPTNHKNLLVQIGSRGYRIQEPPELAPPPEQPSLLRKMIDLHLKDLDFSENELSLILGLEMDEIKEKILNSGDRKRLSLRVG